MTDIRPIDLPELRVDAIRFSLENRDAMEKLIAGTIAGPSVDDSQQAKRVVDVISSDATHAELYWVASGMVELARTAAASLPTFEVKPEDLPSTSGILCMESPIWVGDWPVRGLLWSDSPVGNGLLLATFLDRDEMYGRAGREAPSAIPLMVWNPSSGFAVKYQDAQWKDLSGHHLLQDLLPFLLSAWLLMRQPLAEVIDQEVDRSAKKRLRRAGREPQPVRVINLRRSASSGEQGDGESNYHHQWIVRGHWRNHWHPKREVHRPVWIAPHVKGPEGAPMIGGEKVYAWKR
jgi:hypothetical protein